MPPAGRRDRTRARPTTPRGPGRTGTRRPAARPTAKAAPARQAAAPPAPRAEPRSRFTSRAAILVLVVAVLAIMYSSMLKAYLQQRDHLDDLQSRIDESRSAIAVQEDEVQRAKEFAYVEQQARRLGMAYPGETTYVATRDGEPLVPESSLAAPPPAAEAPAFWEAAWASMEVAGNPDTQADPPPARRIDGAQ